MTHQRRVVVTGLGVVSPIGNDVDTFWRRLVSGESGVGEITRFDTTDYRVRIAAEVQDFDVTDFIDKRKARRLDLFSHYAVAAAIMANDDAGLMPSAEAERVGAVMASGVGGLQTLHVETDKLLHQGPDRTNPLLVPMMIPNMGAAHVSLELGTKGPLSTTCTACAAASDAIGYAARLIRDDVADAMFAGGSEAPISPVGVSGFAAARALSTDNDDPQGASKPFDLKRDGFVIGEGAGVLVLEELQHALARGARIYAELAGSGMSSDSFHMTLPDETGEAQGRAMLMALAEAGLDPSEVDYVNAHGTSTGPGDIAETRAIKHALGDHAYEVAISSNKSMIGHCLGAAGAIEAVATVLTIVNSYIPPTINLHDPDPECDLDYVPLTARFGKVRVAASNSFGFGGHNVSLVFSRHDG
ncbi:MAG TPA: beta-ketoacyl-ACP synthase II [Thermoleophilia bacterium]|nr:MAG: 3-oxoacyl-(acyl-carrier-protein) synthase 2 [Actinobacteria bacterium ADurb.BinA094]HOU27964.1 beta-ketoacyl-ACP synthase II [Thermoleophilia bacterium]